MTLSSSGVRGFSFSFISGENFERFPRGVKAESKFRVARDSGFEYSLCMKTPTTEWTRNYRRIEKAILFIEDNIERRPDLAEVARAAGVSEFHFQRMFSRMVGISPKRYAQFLNKETAKHLLDGSESLLDAAYDAGLSGPGRLHDLFVSCEAVTPGEYKTHGRGLSIAYGFHTTPFGEALLAMTDRGICALYFVSSGERDDVLSRLREEWCNAKVEPDPERTGPVMQRIFADAPSARAPLSIYLRGTNFQVKVWEALMAIPRGSAASYEQIAKRVGAPRATRAVGSAVGRNPIAFLIPCHRVIRKSGDLGGYHWGVPRKRMILAWEAEKAARIAG